jgi:hypothetical protein
MKLSPNLLHRSAADAYRRAANARRFAARFPHVAERELRTAAYWVESGRFWQAEAARDAAAAEPVWIMPTWEQELEYLFGTTAAAEVE